MIRYISLAEYLWLAEQVTGIEAAVLSKAARTELADSALQAPQAAFGGHEFYLDLADKAAVLVCRLAWNHPLPDRQQAGGVGVAGDVPRSQRRALGSRPSRCRRCRSRHVGHRSWQGR